MPDSLSVVDSKPLPDLRVVSSQPLEQPALLSRVASGVGATLQKTADNLNVENMLGHIAYADELAGQGRWADAWNAIRGLLPGGSDSQQVLGNQPGTTFDEQKQFVQDTYQKTKDKDYSGAAANVLTAAAANAEHVAPAVNRAAEPVVDAAKNAASTTATAAKGAVKGVVEANKGGLQNPVHGAAFAANLIPVVGHKLAAAIEAGNNIQGAVKGARQALAERAAEETTPQEAAPETPASPNPDSAGGAPTGGPETATSNPTPENAPAPAEEDTALLDQIARAQTGKPFSKLPPAAQATVRRLAARVAGSPDATPEGGPPPAVPKPAESAARPAELEPPATPGTSAPLPQAAPRASDPAATYPQATQNGVVKPSADGTGAPVPQTEYYPPNGAKHIPTPAELGFGVYAEKLPEDSSALAHIRAENEKAFNAADYAFQKGLGPEYLDQLTPEQSKQFMAEALEHGRAAGNPTPKTAYRTGLDGHTLRLAKAHLAKMVSDARQSGPGTTGLANDSGSVAASAQDVGAEAANQAVQPDTGSPAGEQPGGVAAPSDADQLQRSTQTERSDSGSGQGASGKSLSEDARFARDLNRPPAVDPNTGRSNKNSRYKDADWEVIPAQGDKLPTRIRLNQQALEIIARAVLGPGNEAYGVTTLPGQMANFGKTVARYVQQEYRRGRLGPEGAAKGKALADELARIGNDRVVAFLSDNSQSRAFRLATVREELTHWMQSKLGPNQDGIDHIKPEFMMSHGLWPTVRSSLLKAGYPDEPHTLVAEAGAKLAAGFTTDLGLTKRGAKSLLGHYYAQLAREHGETTARQVLQFVDKITREDLFKNARIQTNARTGSGTRAGTGGLGSQRPPSAHP